VKQRSVSVCPRIEKPGSMDAMDDIPDCSSEIIQCLGKVERFVGQSGERPVVTA